MEWKRLGTLVAAAALAGACPPAGGGEEDGGGSCLADDGAPADLRTDARNCGQCGNACPQPLNAAPRCVEGACGRSACAAGFFDIDGARTFGCESTCVGKVCTDGAGKAVALSNTPLPETGLAAQAVGSGAAFGSQIQTSSRHTNIGLVGDVTPAVDGGIEVRGARFIHRSGFGARAR